MELYEAIEKRRTIRIFDGPATEDQLKKIIIAGTKAPSAVNRQPWEFIIVDDEKIICQLADIKYRLSRNYPSRKLKGDPEAIEKAALSQKDAFANASIVVVCHLKEWERSVWMCLENMSLAAVAEDLATCITLFWDEGQEEAKQVLGIPEDYEVTALLKIGIPGEEGFPRDQNPYEDRRPEFSWLHKNKF